MKLIDIVEGKTRRSKMKKQKAPRAEHLANIMAGRKGGGHFSDKTDFKRAKEKQKFHKETRDMNEAVELTAPTGREHATYTAYRVAREEVREAMNHLNRILAQYYDRGSRYHKPDRDTLTRLHRAASMLDNVGHELAAGTPDDKRDPYDE